MATDVSYEAMVVPFLVATLVYPCITIVSLKLSSQLFGAACVTSFVQAAFVTPFIVPAFWELMSTAPGFECYANSLNLALLPSNATTVFVCATVCGYFVQDCVLMFVKKEAMMKDLGGLSAYMIMWIHHIFSLFIWPYSVVEGKGTVFTVYFLATEVTNIGQNLFLLVNRAKLLPKVLEAPIGITWMLSFFIVRVLPVPFFAWVYLKVVVMQDCGLTTGETAVAAIFVPIPFALNLYWFNKMVAKAKRMLSPPKKAAKKE